MTVLKAHRWATLCFRARLTGTVAIDVGTAASVRMRVRDAVVAQVSPRVDGVAHVCTIGLLGRPATGRWGLTEEGMEVGT